MQKLKLEINVVDDKDISITFWTNSYTKNELNNINAVDLKIHYFINNVEDLTITMVRRIISDKRFEVKTTTFFDSAVTKTFNRTNTFEFQIENEVVLVKNKKTGEELFTRKQLIKSFWNFNLKSWDTIKKQKELNKNNPAVLVNHNIETNETNGGDFQIAF